MPAGQSVRKNKGPSGIAVALSTNALAEVDTPQLLPSTLTVKGGGRVEPEFRVSSTRHGAILNSHSGSLLAVAGAKYPLISITKSVLFVAKTETSPLVPAGTIAPLAVTAPVSAFKVETSGCVLPVGQTDKYPRYPWGTTVKLSE